jgi:hypothetical protein
MRIARVTFLRPVAAGQIARRDRQQLERGAVVWSAIGIYHAGIDHEDPGVLVERVPRAMGRDLSQQPVGGAVGAGRRCAPSFLRGEGRHAWESQVDREQRVAGSPALHCRPEVLGHDLLREDLRQPSRMDRR